MISLRTTNLILSCVFMSLSIYAQEVLYTKYDKFDFRSGEFSVIGKVDDKLYVYRGSAEGYYMDAYDDDMERMATVILDFLPKRSFGTKFITYTDKMIILYQTTESNRVVQYGTVLDKDGRLLKEPVQIDEVKTSFLGGRSGLYNYAISPDKEHIIIYGAGSKSTDLNARVMWLDSDLNKQSTSVVSFAADNDIAFGEGIADNDGHFFLPAYTPYGARQYADRIWMLSLNVGADVFAEAELPLNNLFAAGTYMELSRNRERIYVGGFYSDRKNGNFMGVVYSYYEVNSGEFKETKHIPFSEKLRMASGERNKKRAFNDYRCKQLIVRNDGGFVMIAEDFYVTSRTNYNQGFGYYSWYYPSMSTNVREYNYGDIIAISCNGDGQPEWTKFVRKTQYSQEDGGLFSSYALINTGGSLGFLFNDFNLTRSRIQVASLDGNGQVNLSSLKGVNNDAPDWLPKSGKQVSANEFVVPCLKRNAICFAKVVF